MTEGQTGVPWLGLGALPSFFDRSFSLPSPPALPTLSHSRKLLLCLTHLFPPTTGSPRPTTHRRWRVNRLQVYPLVVLVMVMVTGGNTFPPKVLLSPLGSIEEEDDSVLDEYILDDSSQPTEMAASSFSPPHNVFASPTYLQAHEDESWSSYPISFAAPTFNAVNNPATTQPPHPAQNGMPHDAAGSYPMYGEHPASWQPINIGHGHSHGMPNGLSSPYDIKAEEPTTNSMMLPPNGVPVSTSHDPSQFGQSIASPQSENGWVSTSSTSDQPNKFPSQDTTHRTSFATFPSHLRREGIRKKNARVEIPDGRTIDTIEEEIKMCDPNDEAKLKELKQYKRLLRNREAA